MWRASETLGGREDKEALSHKIISVLVLHCAKHCGELLSFASFITRSFERSIFLLLKM
jgi:hypothetical protein